MFYYNMLDVSSKFIYQNQSSQVLLSKIIFLLVIELFSNLLIIFLLLIYRSIMPLKKVRMCTETLGNIKEFNNKNDSLMKEKFL